MVTRSWLILASAAAGILAPIAIAAVLLIQRTQPSTPASAGSEASPSASAIASTPAAAAAGPATGQPIDGIQCDQSEQVLFHIQAHLAIYVTGEPRPVPAGIGIPNPQVEQSPNGPFVVSGSCFYWLHSQPAMGSSMSSRRPNEPSRWATTSTFGARSSRLTRWAPIEVMSPPT